MRPMPGDDALLGRSRSTSFTDNATTPMPGAQQAPQMTYFLANEKSMEASLDRSSSTVSRSRESMKQSNFGVESLETTTSSLAGQDDDERGGRLGKARSNWKRSLTGSLVRKDDEDMSGSRSTSPKSSQNASRDMSPSQPKRSSQSYVSRPFNAMTLESPLLGSVASSPSSRRNSETDFSTDDVASQAIVSSGEDETEGPSEIVDSSSASQLVMPSIKMPSRRPFTEKGRNIGRLKVLVAGDSGVGKTSLIKAIVQICEDIVHVDPFSPTPSFVSETLRRKSKTKTKMGSTKAQSTCQISEIYASTRAFPHWWTDFDDGKVMKRRKSTGDSVLERNLCFVDTPGYGNGTSCMESITPVIQYVESHLEKCSSLSGLSEGDMMSMLSGNGGSLVDLVFYLIPQSIKPVDIEYLRRLSPLTNVIPLIARADALSPEEIRFLKTNISSELQAADIRPFTFGASPEEALDQSRPLSPFAVSTATTSDNENMDASLLMSPDYVQPLIPTELALLVDQIFERETASWLRHSAAKKCLQWRRSSSTTSALTRSIPQSVSMNSSYSLVASSSVATSPLGATNNYSLARITDHTQHEERLAQVRLSKWATDLQRSLQNEKARFEALARGERAVWLTERLNECVQDGTLVPISAVGRRNDSPISRELVKQGGAYTRRTTRGVSLDRHDPLGLLQLNADMRRKSWAALQIVGSFGIIGGLAIWLVRNWNSENNESFAWGFDWTRLMLDW